MRREEALNTHPRNANQIGHPVEMQEFHADLEHQSGRRLIAARRGPEPEVVMEGEWSAASPK